MSSDDIETLHAQHTEELDFDEMDELHEAIAIPAQEAAAATVLKAEAAPRRRSGPAPTTRYFNGQTTHRIICNRCRQPGHVRRDCRMRVKTPCSLCGSRKHDYFSPSFDCPFNDSVEPVSCYWCGTSSHHISVCKAYRKPKNLQELRCYVCGERGHVNCSAERMSDQFPEIQVQCCNCASKSHTIGHCTAPRMRDIIDPKLFRGTIRESQCRRCGNGGHIAMQCATFSRSIAGLSGNKRQRFQ